MFFGFISFVNYILITFISIVLVVHFFLSFVGVYADSTQRYD